MKSQLASPRRAKDGCLAWASRLILAHADAIEARYGPLLRTGGKIGPPLGRGRWGCVLPFADGRRVLKITCDKDEGPLALYVKTLQEKRRRFDGVNVCSGTAIVHDVFRLSEDGEPPRYGIVRESLRCDREKLPVEIATLADAYTDAWNDAYRSDLGRSGRRRHRDKARAILGKMRKLGRQGRNLATVLEGLWDDGAAMMDAHADNLCVRTRMVAGVGMVGDVVLMDFGASAPDRSLDRVERLRSRSRGRMQKRSRRSR